MAGIRIIDYSIANLIDSLRSATWQVPKFQREFVWDTSAIAALATSIIDAYPVGMITLWEQSDRNPLDLERLSIQDYDGQARKQVTKYFGSDEGNQRVFAILDGRQRCTAVAMAFAGFTPEFRGSKYAGRYFLNASQPDPLERVVFKKASELEKAGLTTSAACIGKGLFPLASDVPGEAVLRTWYRYAQEIKNPENYPNGELPEATELERRNAIVQSAFDGITETKLAACIVPEKYDLGQICEIFETLNLSGMKVSTVDLINSWIYRETEANDGGPIHIREWIRDFGQIDGAVGWAVPERRPELIAQIVTAAFVALDRKDKPKPRQVSGTRKVTTIDSVKSPDLLATPALHWEFIVQNDRKLAAFLGDFQRLVADGLFSYDKCPYPISCSIYTGIRWHKEFDPISSHGMWSVADLNSLFKAFFWRNALATRYDQGFLTTLAKDLSYLKDLLRKRGDYKTKSAWLQHCDEMIATDLINSVDLPTRDQLIDYLTDGRPGGARQTALLLPMIAGTVRDIDGVDISLTSEGSLELHHIFPRSWCADNASGKLKAFLDKEEAGRDWVNSIANLMPLARPTNNEWKAKSPRTFIENSGIKFQSSSSFFKGVFIGPEEFKLLLADPKQMPAFWSQRAGRIADDLLERTKLMV
ncbi:GmrSD restriction endonuclease domain-containing protein [Tardiphaga sp. 839_C3_N1_4]|uniref:GmrSD restriction endonuclease domain-containing protein n=1 Tax=Tardiphaga sp. 839_C3_N1_4 TaxID=3240761 RepID=UPI003F23BFF6